EPSLQRAVSELFGCWDESALQIETSAEARASFERKPEPLALPPAPVSRLRQRPLMYMGAAVLIGLGLSTMIVITAGSSANPPPAAAAEVPSAINSPVPSLSVSSPEPNRSSASSPKPKRLAKAVNTDHTEEKLQSIKVVMQIENGRVLNASVANHKA